MSLVIMKFGGSSLANADKIKHVAERIIVKKKDGNKVVAVVSAPGDTTDDLIKMVDKIACNPPVREVDMLLATGEMVSISLLAMAIDAMGEEVISMTGPQAGILANEDYTRARIKKINPQKINDQLAKDNIVIVAGFQALNPRGDVTTLGRGGSDLTAVALAVALKSDLCEIYSDVEGVYTADPRVVKDARKIDYISYDEMLEMAGSGSQVLQSRSVEVAKKFNVVIHSKSTFSESEGTIITSEEKIKEKKMESFLLSGISFDKSQVKFTISVFDASGIVTEIFSRCSEVGINIDMLDQSVLNKSNTISFIVNRSDMKKTQEELDKMTLDFKASVSCNEHIAKISIIGVGVKSHSVVAAKMFKILHKSGIDVNMVSISEIKISCIISESDVLKAVEELHKGFGLSKKRVDLD
ncbi:MAG: aspartate kinase [Endomicrobium sp.]|jgi:aspartate kinase|nr:aspartate kinase [Endomicrobium sp.]